jgi:hypothetical protein
LNDDYEKLNKGYDAIMNIIEITTKKVYSYPLKSKTSEEVFKSFELFLKAIDNKLNLFEIDKGTEFSKVIKYCDDMCIPLCDYLTYDNLLDFIDNYTIYSFNQYNRIKGNNINKFWLY